jgi:hypothetical protein
MPPPPVRLRSLSSPSSPPKSSVPARSKAGIAARALGRRVRVRAPPRLRLRRGALRLGSRR